MKALVFHGYWSLSTKASLIPDWHGDEQKPHD